MCKTNSAEKITNYCFNFIRINTVHTAKYVIANMVNPETLQVDRLKKLAKWWTNVFYLMHSSLIANVYLNSIPAGVCFDRIATK